MIQAVIFNLDGVLVATDTCHYQAWAQLAKEQGLPFNDQIFERMQGMKRMDSLRMLLKRAERNYSVGEVFALSARKNDIFNELILGLKPNGREVNRRALGMIQQLRDMGIKTAVASSSENAGGILRQLHLEALFDVIVDGGEISKGKPDPEVFFLTARRLAVPTANCLVVENCRSGVEAARQCGMRVLGLGSQSLNSQSDWWAENLDAVDLQSLVLQEEMA